MRSLLPVPLLALALVACADDGPETSQTRDVPAFARLATDSAVDVRVRVGGPERPLTVRAGENVIGDVRTEVRDGTLHVQFDHSGWGGDDVTVEAWTPRLAGITTDGSGDVEAEGVQGGSLAVDTGGSGDVRVQGRADAVALTLDGSGDAELADLAAGRARVQSSGSGDVDVRVAEQLDVEADGSGDVRYHGQPRVTQRDDGSGEVQRAN